MHSAFAAQRGTNYNIPADVLDSGGADVSKSNSYTLSDSIGESIIGYGSTNNYILNSGYRQPSASDFISVSCSNTVNLGSVVGTGLKTGSGTCVVYTDAYDGYRLIWNAGSNNRRGLVGHWKMDETSGTTAYDSSGYGNNGTLTNGPVITNAVPSRYFSTRSVNFDGTNDYVDVGNPSGLQRTTGTMSAWIKTSGAGQSYRGIVAKQLAYGMFLKDNVFMIYDWGTATDRSSGVNLGDNAWHHVTVTFKSGVTNGTQLWVDGILRLTTTMTVLNQNVNLQIGWANASNQYFNGLIDDVRIYDRALSAAEIRDLASKAPPGSLTASGSQTAHIPGIFFPSTGGLVGHWKMEEPIAGSTVADSSGYNNDGTPTGAGGANNLPQPSTSVPGSTTFLTTRSLDFDGVDDRLNITRFTVLTSRTFAAWVKTTSTDAVSSYPGNAALNILGDSTGSVWIGFGVHGGKVRYMQHATGWQNVTGGISVNDGSWHHVVATHNSVTNTVNVYVDGVLDATGTITFNAVNPAVDRIGCGYNNLDFFDGSLDDVRIYNRALSEAEIKALYGAPQPWSVTATGSAWGARLSSRSTDTDSKWGTDAGTTNWLNIGEGSYPLARRATATPLTGSTEIIDFRAEVGSSAVQESGVYTGVAGFTVVGY